MNTMSDLPTPAAHRIADPLGADFQIGARESEVSRIAPVVAPPPPDIPRRDAAPSLGFWARFAAALTRRTT